MMVEVPCKIGDLAWGIRKYKGAVTPIKGKVSEMFFVGNEMQLCIVVKCVCRGEWGKQVFETREEALKAIKRGEFPND